MVRPDTLVGIVTSRADVQRFHEQRWYRVPVANWPRERWNPTYVALFETIKATGDEQCVRYWGKVIDTGDYTRAELLPNEPSRGRDTKLYKRILVERCEELTDPIVFHKRRRNPFLLTTKRRLLEARSASDLILGSGLEERIWEGLRELAIPAEREWYFPSDNQHFWLDFAVFCHRNNIDVEVDGDHYHMRPAQVEADKRRDNLLEDQGWTVRRFTQTQILEDTDGVIRRIRSAIARAGGLVERFDSRKFTYRGKETMQLSLMEDGAEYDAGPPPQT